METTRIFIVEPEGNVAADLGQRLKKMGHTVIETATGAEQALDAAQGTRPDLVFIDTSLESSSGWGSLTVRQRALRRGKE